MSVDRISVAAPQSSAGILGIGPTTNLRGIKIDPKVAVIFAAVFVVLVKIIDMLLAVR